MVDPDYTATIGLDRDQARALVAAADADRGPRALRTAAVIRLLLHNGLRVDEVCAADVADLGTDAVLVHCGRADTDPAAWRCGGGRAGRCAPLAWTIGAQRA
jgi:integrase